jgi:hypothetical protein
MRQGAALSALRPTLIAPHWPLSYTNARGALFTLPPGVSHIAALRLLVVCTRTLWTSSGALTTLTSQQRAHHRAHGLAGEALLVVHQRPQRIVWVPAERAVKGTCEGSRVKSHEVDEGTPDWSSTGR